MSTVQELLAKFKGSPNDVLGVDISNTGIKCVRMRKNKDDQTVVAADIIPYVDPSEKPAEDGTILDIPQRLKARYVSLAVSGEGSTVKLLSFPGAFKDTSVQKVIESLGIEDLDNYRIAYKVITEGHGKSESRVLAVAIPETEAVGGPALFPTGRPAPYSLEISGLAATTAFINGPVSKHQEDAIGAIDFGDAASTFTLFNKGVMSLVRRFDIGTDNIVEKVQESLGVDKETAQGIITDGAFDISQSVNEIMEPLVKQLIISRDFVERRENCNIATIFASGGIVVSHDALDEMRSSMGVKVESWNPFEIDGINIAPDAIPESLKGQEWQFAAALGACIATFEEE